MKTVSEIKGITTENSVRSEPVYQYADDTTLLLEDVKSVERVMVVLNTYCNGSGAKIHFEKSICMCRGNDNIRRLVL